MEKIWLKYYPKDVKPEIDADKYRNIVAVFDESVKKNADKPAFHCMGKTITYRQFDELSQQFASYLQNHTNLKPGDRIALQMPNVLQYPVCLYGALRAGMVVVNTNPLYTPREMEHQFNDSGAKAVVILENFANHLEEVLPKTKIETVIVTALGDLLGFPKGAIVNFVVRNFKKGADGKPMVPKFNLPAAVKFNSALSKGKGNAFKPVDIKSEDIAFLQYTGGTTGVSKGAMLTHRNVVANMEQAGAWIGDVLVSGNEVIITPLPLYHIFALTINCLLFVKYGGLNVLITNPRDIPGFVKELAKWNGKFTFMTGVNTLFNALLNNAEFAKLDFSKLKVSVGGAMAMQAVVVEKWKKVTNSPILEGYGLTETSPAAIFNPLDGRDRVGFIGMPLPSSDVLIKDDDGNVVPVGEAGEICISGPHVMKGYWQRPEETANVIRNGYLHTGDVAYMTEDGFFKIVDRKKDMILVSGFNVFPNEVEEVVSSHPGVLEVAAIGIPSEHSGEAVKIIVVRKDPNLRADDLEKFCRERLTNYKVPKVIEFRPTELPKSNVGKILRRVLRDEDKRKNGY